MTEKTVKVITCDGPKCLTECRDGIIPIGWITFTGITGDHHLCPTHATEHDINQMVYYQAMERISRERGD